MTEIVRMKAKKGGDIVYRPAHFLDLYPELLGELPSARAEKAEKTTEKKETK